MGGERKSWRVVILALVAAWLGWGFDVFDGLLLSYVATPTLNTLLAKAVVGPAGETILEKPDQETLNASIAYLNSLLLVGWAIGGILFGRLTDRLGRTKTLLLTMLLYAGATALCAASPNLAFFVVCRALASLGIGGEWAAGASLLAEVVSERGRPLAGALLFTASPMGMWFASKVDRFVVKGVFLNDPQGWRYAFLLGLVPAAFAFAIRIFVEEPERWKEHKAEPARLSELFAKDLRRKTLTALGVATVCLVGWWGINGFIPKVMEDWCKTAGVAEAARPALKDGGNDFFILGSVIGTLVTVPLAVTAGRKLTFALYFLGALAASGFAFGSELLLGTQLSLEARLRALSLVGFFVFGVFGLFPFYLPELFPTRLRGTGSGFCYNTGRLVTAVGVFGIGKLQAQLGLTRAVLCASAIYVLGLIVLPLAVETKGASLE
ncbi:MFS transporter [bacterium]|nr:MFS transporter [bacterium]